MAQERPKIKSKKAGNKRIYALSVEETIDAIHDLHIQQAEREAANMEFLKHEQTAGSGKDYADVFDITPIGFFLFGEDGLIRRVNRAGAKMLGVDKQLIEGKPFLAFVEPESAVEFYEQLRKAVSTKERLVLELRIKRAGSCSFPAELDTTPLFDDDGKFVLFRAIITDTLDRKAATKSMLARQGRP